MRRWLLLIALLSTLATLSACKAETEGAPIDLSDSETSEDLHQDQDTSTPEDLLEDEEELGDQTDPSDQTDQIPPEDLVEVLDTQEVAPDLSPPAGSLGGPCHPDEACDAGLACLNDLCQEVPTGSLGGTCYPNQTCDEGLLCLEEICHDDPTGEEGETCRPDGSCDPRLLCRAQLCVPMSQMHFVQVSPQTFKMGSPEDELGRSEAELLHTVQITRAYLIKDTEVTQEEWQLLMENNPSFSIDAQKPVEQVTWFDALSFCNALSELEGLEPCYDLSGICTGVPGTTLGCDGVPSFSLDCNGYRLPTEAEWELAARGGTQGALPNGDLSVVESCDALDPNLNQLGWYCANTDTTQQVKKKLPNSWGLFDMHGNVKEWCWDGWADYSDDGVQVDPIQVSAIDRRVHRGGGIVDPGKHLRSASRRFISGSNLYDQYLGFRIVRSLP